MKITNIVAHRKVRPKTVDGQIVDLRPSKKIKYFLECESCNGGKVKIKISEKSYNKLIGLHTGEFITTQHD